MGHEYGDGLSSENDYRGQKQTLEMELESLVVPEVDAAADAGELLKRLPDLWEGASLDERHEL
ncbi:MAG: recombinase family protein, partial [Chloroflexi bacterium]|nr:recombinase family protein [Chloroflexota bacterium]